MNKFQCDYDNCNRTLSCEKEKAFGCTMCGHGKMKLIKPTTTCINCEDPIFGNVTPSNEKVPFFGGHDYVGVICSKCTHKKVEDIQEWEKLLHTKFTDTDDYDEKLILYRAKVREAEEANADISKIRVKSFGSRLKTLRKKLKLTQKQLAEHVNITQRSVINYEKDERQPSIEIKDWIKSSEGTLKHIGKDKGKALIMENLSELNDNTE